MALSIPIVSEFNGKGIERAIKEFKNLEGAGAKAQFALKKAALPAAAALTALGAAATVSVKAAMADQAAQRELARTLTISAEATNSQVAAVERQIAVMERASGIADDELRPAFAALVRGTKDITQATTGLQLAMDISAATGQDLAGVSDALSKAYGGNMRGLRALSPEMAALIKEGADLDTVLSVLGGTFGGAMAENAATAEGRMRRFSVAIDNAKENIGHALLPVVEGILPFIERFGQLAENNTKVFLIAGGVIGGLAATILVLNAAIKAYRVIVILATAAQAAFNFIMSANPIGLVIIAIAALVAGFVLLEKRFGIVTIALKFVGDMFHKFLIQPIQTAIALIGNLINAISRIPAIGGIGKIAGAVTGFLGNIPGLADGGIVSRPTLAMIGEAGPEAVVPLNRAGGMGTTINIYSTIADETLPEKLVQALRSYNRTTGPVRIQVI